MLGETAKLITELDLRDGLTPGLTRAGSALSRFASQGRQHLDRIARGTGQVATGIGRIATLAAGAAVGGLFAAGRAAANFGDQLNIINTIAQTTPDKLKNIGDGIRRLSTETGADLSDLTSAYYDLLSAGIKVEDAQGDLNLAYKLSRGALSTTGEAVDFLTTALNAYGLKGRDAARISDMFAQSVADGKVKLDQIAATFSDVASIAAVNKIGINEVAAAYGLLTAKGSSAGEAATGMKRAIISLASPNGELAALEAMLKRDYSAIASREGLVPALQQLRTDANKYGFDLYKLLGRQEAYAFTVKTTGSNLAGFNQELQRINQSAGATERQFGERQQGLAYQFGRLKANVLDAAIAVGEGFAPALGRLADKATAYIRDHRDDFVNLGKRIGEALDGIDWGAVESGAQTMLSILKAGYEVIKLIPPQVSLVVAGFAGLNKLSGGLLGAGVGNIVGGLGGVIGAGLGRAAASKIPGLNQLIAQPVFVTNWPVGLGAGGGAGGVAAGGSRFLGAVRMLGAVTIAGASIMELAQQFGQFQEQVGKSQAELQAQADASANESADTALRDIAKYTSHLRELQGFDRILADTFGGKQEADALRNLSHAVVANGRLSTSQLTQAIEALQAAQTEATARGNTDVAQSIGADIATLQARLAGKLGQVDSGIDRLNQKPTQITVNTTVNTSVSVRDVDTRTRTARRYGMVAV